VAVRGPPLDISRKLRLIRAPMAGRTASSSRAAPSAACSIDVVLLTCHDRRLRVIAESAGKQRVELPWGTLNRGEALDVAAARIARQSVDDAPAWIEQVGAFADGAAHPSGAPLSVCYVGVRPWTEGLSWKDTSSASTLAERQRRMLSTALGTMRARAEQRPIAFSMLAREFTLSELQATYETILSRHLHKASFRRALQAAFLVEPTGEWRGEGRGRPAQLYRYAPRRRKGASRGLRLDLL
jgi:8-oxo-dGTP diphosphatase